MIETLGTLCVLWTVVEFSGLALRARRVTSHSVRAWDSQGNEVEVEMVE
jgi:hypothetical protein